MKNDKLLGRFIVLFKHDLLGIFIPYFTRKIWNKTTQ